jgi:Tfp pilus assembly protein PilF
VSLLLDALKRAEDAKRAKAEAATGSQSEQSNPAESASTKTSGALALEDSRRLENATDAVDVPLLSLEADDHHAGKPVLSARLAISAAEVSTSEPTPSAPALTLEAMLDSELGYTDGKKSEQPPLTLAVTPTHSKSLNSPQSLIELENIPTQADIASVAAPAPTPTPTPAPDLESNRQAIKNAFAVKQTATNPAKAKWILPVVSVLIGAAGVGSWYVWNEVNRLNKPGVALVLRPAAATPDTTPDTTPATIPATTSATATPPPAVAAITTENAASPTADGKPTTVRANDAPAALPPLLPPPATQIKDERKTAPQTPAPATPREAVARKIDALPPLGGAENGANRILLKPSSANVQTVSTALSAGYAALIGGDYATAKRRYAEAISANNNNVDAHLGFATAAARSGDASDLALAITHYQRVLELDPRNSTASAALIVFSAGPATGRTTAGGASNPLAEKESELKLLIAHDPTSANAHYLLGNLYAEQRRWRDAQQSFFEATRLAPQIADYSYNLAVSLDNLNQAVSAANFYRRALSATTKGQFDTAAVQRRISQLTEPAKDNAVSR